MKAGYSQLSLAKYCAWVFHEDSYYIVKVIEWNRPSITVWLVFHNCNVKIKFLHVFFSTASPIITTQPKSQTFKDNEKNILTLWIIATGIGPIYYQWQKYNPFSNSWISPSSRADNIISPNLTFTVITEEDEGLYRCIASNDDGDVFSDYANITVYGKDIAIHINCRYSYVGGHIDGFYTYFVI